MIFKLQQEESQLYLRELELPKNWPGDEFFKLRKSKFWECKRAKNTLFVTLWPCQHWLSPITSKKDKEVEHYATSAYPSLLLFPRVSNILKMVQIHLWLPCSRNPCFTLSHLATVKTIRLLKLRGKLSAGKMVSFSANPQVNLLWKLAIFTTKSSFGVLCPTPLASSSTTLHESTPNLV